MATFKELLKASFKSADTEETLDIYFNRPIGLVFALLWNKLGIHPNVITIVSIFLGAAAGWMFHYTDLQSNLLGVVLLMFANFCDSTDGQMARLSGKKTLVGRMLDGFSGDVWFFCIYLALVIRLWQEPIPGLDIHWGVGALVLMFAAGVLSHSPQSSLADYYRQIHLFFLLGKKGSELDTYAQQRENERQADQWFARIYYHFYANYCKSQEQRTPQFQRFFKAWNDNAQQLPAEKREALRQAFLKGSRPLMGYTNLLTFNSRAITLYITAVLGALGPYDWVFVYPLLEIIVLNGLYYYMHRKHERICKGLM